MVDFSAGGVLQAIRAGQMGLATHVASQLLAQGHPDGPAALTIASLGNRGLGSFGGGRQVSPGVPMVAPSNLTVEPPGKIARLPASPFLRGDLRAPTPGDFPIITVGGRTAYAAMDAFGGGQPFSLVGFVSLGAGSQTQGTDLVDFHAATANPTIISTADLVIGNIEVFEASLYVGVRAATTLGIENAALLMQAWVIEYINGIEKSRWHPKMLGCCISQFGVITNGGLANNYSLDIPAVPFHRKYDPNIKAKTALQVSVTYTSIEVEDYTLAEAGTRP